VEVDIHTMIIPPAASSNLYKVIQYKSIWFHHDLIAVSYAGECFVGALPVACDTLDLGEDTLWVSFRPN
jgi:hypothetical protein